MMGFVLKISVMVALHIVVSQQEIFTFENDSDILLENLAVVTGNPQENCFSICKETPGCEGFSWSKSYNGTCWLKSGTGPIAKKNGYSVGILQKSNAGVNLDCTISSSGDISLPESAAYHSHTQESCYIICNSSSNCKGFIWNENEGTCWLKAGIEPLTQQDNFYVGIMTVNAPIVKSDEFANAVVSNGYPRPPANKYQAFIQGLPKGSISSKEEAAMALAQLLHESDGLRAKRERRCEKTGCPGEYVTKNCDVKGQRYYGRGYIQLTWCYNYRAASRDLFRDDRLVSKPDSVATDENLAWNTAFWFWKVNVHSKPGVAQGAFGATTKAINGALECTQKSGHAIAQRRYRIYGKVRAAFHLPGPGNEKGCYN